MMHFIERMGLKKMSLKNSFIISGVIHGVIFVLFLIFSRIDPFQDLHQPIVVDLESVAEAMSEGIEENLEEAQHQQSPVHNEQIRPEDSTPVVPEKATPQQKQVQVNEDYLKEKVKKDNQTDVKNQLKEVRTQTGPVISKEQQELNELDKQLEEFLSKEEANRIQDEELTKMEDDIEKILDEAVPDSTSDTGISANDKLKGGEWNAAPRKTVTFPDLASAIPEEYKKKGQNYKIRVRITFDKNGLAIRTQVIISSGDPMIDAVFQKELRKVRVEPISRDRLDWVEKTFTISTK